MAVLLLGTFDTKGNEYAFVRDLITEAGQEVVLVDAGVMGTPSLVSDVGPDAVAAAGGTSLEELRRAGDRGAALRTMAAGAAVIVRDLHARGRLSGVLALGGSGGSSIAAAVMRVLPVGLPKLLVSTMASGDVSSYVGQTDVTLMYSVVDVAGINSISRQILGNAAAAISAMAAAYTGRTSGGDGRALGGDERTLGGRTLRGGDKPLVAATMFGVTTPAVDAARARLEDHGYEVVVFHA
ncbi:Tm-1-like ATP-binding domain-containing protein, partial [Nonomuraea cypriaca]|uniref:Tm-1-like ATP-binding domain-containing protein n=1 Tax=Nonomuraea cypriaca TaxID=1187855 RepID=UPI002E2E532C